MTATLISPPLASERENLHSDGGNGIGGGSYDPGFPRHENKPPSQSPYRLLVIVGMVWIVGLFGTLACVLERRWGHSNDWVAIQLPPSLYVNTALLLLSSLSLERARRFLRLSDWRHTRRWLLATVLLGIAFVGGQAMAWRELVVGGLGIASNPGACLFYLITGAHLVVLTPGIVALLVAVFSSDESAQQRSTVDVVALYWNFLDVLWLTLAALLFITIQ